LSPKEFDQFATYIAEFNSGTQTADYTLSAISKLIKDPGLVQKMKQLIMRALAETSQASINVEQQPKGKQVAV
jgi:hypothetical protein